MLFITRLHLILAIRPRSDHNTSLSNICRKVLVEVQSQLLFVLEAFSFIFKYIGKLYLVFLCVCFVLFSLGSAVCQFNSLLAFRVTSDRSAVSLAGVSV